MRTTSISIQMATSTSAATATAARRIAASALRPQLPAAAAAAAASKAYTRAAWRTFSSSSAAHDEHQQQQQLRVKSEALNRTRSKIPSAKAKAAQASRAQLRPSPHPPPTGPPQAAAAAAATSPSPPPTRRISPSTLDDHHADLPEVIAYSTAQAYDFSILARSERLPPGWSFLEEGDVIHIPTWPPLSPSHDLSPSPSPHDATPLPGETFIFRSGAYVTWGLTEDQARRFHRAVIRGRPAGKTNLSRPDSKFLSSVNKRSSSGEGGPGGADTGSVEVGAYDRIGDEAMEYLIRDDQPTRVVGDLIVLGHKPRLPSSPDPSAPSDGESDDPQRSTAGPATTSTSDDSSTYAPWSPLLARLSFSLGLARSARLTTQENSLDMFMLNPSSSPSLASSSSSPHTSPFVSSGTQHASSASSSRALAYSNHPGSARIPLSDIPRELERTGRVPLGRKEVIKRMGKLLRLRLEANLDVEESFLDDNAFWENERLQNHYESICRALDIDRRFKAFNEKLDHVESLLSTLRALLTESSSHRMELIIIILIAIEVLNAFFGHQHQLLPQQSLSSSSEEGQSDGSTATQQTGGFSLPSVSGLLRWISSRSTTASTAS
ncbi:hypothetical protein V8E36_003320 [Tilletia maclaganii]